MKRMQKAVDGLTSIVLLLIFIVIITAEALMHSTGGICFEILCLSIAALLVRVIDTLQVEIDREKKIAQKLKYEQKLRQKREKDMA